jgi:hypothetical protein
VTDNPSSSSQPPQPPNFQVRIPVEWAEDGDTPMMYANQVMVSYSGPEFFVVFGVLVPPANPNDLPDVMTIKPQVRVAIAREAMPVIVKALNENLARYQAAMSRRAGSGEGSGGGGK